MEKHEVVIVGAGPAGLEAAKILAENGKDVLVLEKAKEKEIGEKPCTTALFAHIFDAIGVPKDLIDVTCSHVGAYFADGSYKEVELSAPFCYTCKRTTLSDWMVEQAKKAEAELRDETTVKKIKRRENAIELESGEEIGYSTLIGADGANSVVRKALGLTSKSMDAAEIRVDIPPAEIKNGGKDKAHSYWSADVFGHGYFGYVPFKDHVEFGLFSFDNEFFTFAEKIKRVKRFVKETDEIDLEQYKTKAWKICYGYVGMKHDNIYLIGDAGGFGTINAGEIYVAAESGKLAAKDILGQSIKDEMDDLMEWRKGWNSIDLLLRYYRFLPSAVKRRVTKMVMDHGAPFVFNHKIVLDIGYYFLNKKLFEGGPR